MLAIKDLAEKTIEGIVPSARQAHKMSDEELIEHLVQVRGIGRWTVEMLLHLPPWPARRAGRR